MDSSQTVNDTTESNLISRILAGETDLYESIVRKYNAYLYRVGRAYGFDHADVEDLMQETYINAYVHLSQFERRSSFRTWIVRIMLNHCYHKRKKSVGQKETAPNNGPEEKSISMFDNHYTDATKALLNRELKRIIENAVQHIPEDYRMVFTLRELNGMSVNETSEALHISESNVKVRLSRAKNMLRKEIQKVYSPEEIFEFNLIYCDKIVERVMNAVHALSPTDLWLKGKLL
jgi:RNA polymerase sigma-70 factor (ECF subfamily)